MKYPIKILSVILPLIVVTSCEKQDTPGVKTESLTRIEMNQAIAGGLVTDDANAEVVDRGVCWSTAESPTIADNKTHNGSGPGYYQSVMDKLMPDTRYYFRAYATNRKGTGYGNELTFKTNSSDVLFNPNLSYDTLIDIEGNTYKTIQIGTQKWMAENLRTTKYNDGTDIPVDNNVLNGIGSKYHWYNNDEITYKFLYGGLYKLSDKVCPAGWHIPSLAEWKALVTYLGGDSIAGGRMKETGTSHWTYPNKGATNESGFSALPGGMYSADAREMQAGIFFPAGSNGYWWCNDYFAFMLSDQGSHAGYLTSGYWEIPSFSVRCLKN